MAKIQICESDSVAWVEARERIDELALPVDDLSPGELESSSRILQPGSEDRSELHEGHFPPGTVVSQHAHDVEEIIYVTAGELRLGSKVLRPGSSIYISANTLYSFRAGPDGLTFANFRPRGNVKYLSKAQFLDRRRDGDTSGAPTENGSGSEEE